MTTSVLKLAAVWWLIFDASAYTTNISTLFMTTIPTDITNALAGTSNGPALTAGAFDTAFIKAWTAALVIFRQLSVSDPATLVIGALCGILFIVAAVVSLAVAFVIYLISHLVLGLYIIVGPLLIASLLFERTAGIFGNWISALISCVLLQIGIVILMSMLIQVEQKMAIAIVGDLTSNIFVQIGEMLAGIGLFIVAGYLALEMRDWANSLSAGMHSQAGGVLTYLAARTVSRAGGAIASKMASKMGRGGGPAPASFNAFANAYENDRRFRQPAPPPQQSLSSGAAP